MKQARRKWGRRGADPPVFGQTVNPISTREADYARHSTTSPFGFSDLATALGCITLLTTTNFREDMSELTKYDYVYLQQGI